MRNHLCAWVALVGRFVLSLLPALAADTARLQQHQGQSKSCVDTPVAMAATYGILEQ